MIPDARAGNACYCRLGEGGDKTRRSSALSNGLYLIVEKRLPRDG